MLADPIIDSTYRYNDPRLSSKEREVIHAAAAYLRAMDPYFGAIDQLRFTVRPDQNEWWVNVWCVEPGKVNPPGNFVSVHVDSRFVVKSVTGGA